MARLPRLWLHGMALARGRGVNLADRFGITVLLVVSWVAAGCDTAAPRAPSMDSGQEGARQGSGECEGTWDYEPGHSPELPRPPYLGATGSGVLSLDERLADGWRVSLVSGDLAVPGPLADGGALSSFSPGDRVQVTERTHCVPFSGCKEFIAIRDARDGSLITASFHDGPERLPDFGAALGVPLTLQPLCSFPTNDVCFVNQVETHYSVRLAADRPVDLERHSHTSVTIDGSSYTAWLGGASTVTGDAMMTASSAGCLDQGSLWATGGVELLILP